MKVRGFFPYTVTIDGEPVALRLKRFDVNESMEFRALFKRIVEPFALRYAVRRPDEQDRDEAGAYCMPDDQIAERRVHEMTPEQRDEYRRAEEAAEVEARTNIATIIDRFVTVESGLLEELPDGSEQSVTKGADFLRLYAGRWEMLAQIVALAAAYNTVGEDQKKSSPSPFASFTSSTAPAGAGPRPETTAASAAGEASVRTAVAAPTTPDASSGSTATSPRDAVPSVN